MTLSLTKEQIGERLLEPQRLTLLRLAIDEDVKSIFPLHFTKNDEENSLIMTEAMSNLVNKLLFRAITLAYDEILD